MAENRWESISLGKVFPQLEDYKKKLEEDIAELEEKKTSLSNIISQYTSKYQQVASLVIEQQRTQVSLVTNLQATGFSAIAVSPPSIISGSGGWPAFFAKANLADEKPGITSDGAVAGIMICCQYPTLARVMSLYPVIRNLFTI